jgi:hypothetical protein
MTLKITEEMENSLILRLLQEAAAVCFIGDSLTEGTIAKVVRCNRSLIITRGFPFVLAASYKNVNIKVELQI